MEGKKQQIIRAAIQCFSEKGYRGTSIQDIADVLGIAKGSLYFYFKSKSDLLQFIIKDYLDRIMAEYVDLNSREDLKPRDLLRRHVLTGHRMYEENQAFFSMLLRERFEVHDELHELMMNARRQGLVMTHELICKTYGDRAHAYARDLTIIFQSMTEGFLALVVFEQQQIDPERLADYIIARLDAMVADLSQGGNDPIIGPNVLEGWLASVRGGETGKAELLAEIQALREAVSAGVLDPADNPDEVQSTLDVLSAELDKSESQPVVLKGMLALLKAVKTPDIRKRALKLESGLQDRLQG
ncbi:TetR/AcrR family transcriptional regulator [Paenibacillus xanthanilyticus]|uniref:TetR/AcrR family transcriptional regulator n=1 Tax=Paenibacillus xanthanilyticus TaxID=1783531 RepID=A0ABV8K2E4_9BACL